MKKLHLLVAVLLNICLSKAQINIQPPNLDAASLFKLTESPVSLHNGLVDISLPLYEIRTKGINIPIVLNYYSRGVRVEDIASNVGLGWSLSYGGMISRQVRDRPDDGANGYLLTNTYSNFFTDQQKRVSVYNQLLFEPHRDLVPDQFYFSLPNYSGKFIFDQFDKSILQQRFSDIKIQTDPGNVLKSWTVTDDRGNKYYFGKVDDVSVISQKQTENYVQKNPFSNYTALTDNSNEQYDDTWYLQKIETAFGEIIKYNYIPDGSSYYTKSYDKVVSPCISPCDQPDETGVFTYFSKVIENKYILESIEFPEGKLKFTASASLRQDIMNGHSLEQVTLYDKNNNIVETNKLVYAVVESPNTSGNTNPLLSALDPSSGKRMFLKEVIRQKNGTIIDKKIYHYNTVNLPNRFSTSQDLWGYYNKAANGTYLHFFDYNGQMSSDRTTDTENSKAGLLESIQYATGGTEKFTFENNILVPTFNFNRILGVVNTPYEEKEFMFLRTMDSEPDFNASENTYYADFTIDDKYIGNYGVDIDFNYHVFNNPSFPKICSYYLAWIEKNNQIVTLFPNIGISDKIQKGTSKTFALQPGNYRLKIKAYGCAISEAVHNPSESVTLQLSWKSQSLSTDEYFGPGNRIRKIEYFDGNQLSMQKTYQYTDENNNNSGNLFGMREYAAIIGYKNSGTAETAVIDPRGVMAGSLNSHLESNNLGYSYVKEFTGDTQANKGRTDHEFTNFPDGGNFMKYPFYLAEDNQWMRGLNVRTKYYQFNNGNYTLVRAASNVYQYGGFDDPSGFTGPQAGFEYANGMIKPYQKNRNYYLFPLAKYYQDYSSLLGSAGPGSQFLIFENGNTKMYYKPYYFSGGKIELKQSDITSYEPVGDLTNTTEYTYNSPSHYQLSRQKVTLPEGTINETTYSYAHEKGNQLMIDRNMVGIPLETVSTQTIGNTTKTLSRSETIYPTSVPTSQSANLVLPLSVKSYDVLNNNASYTEATYDKYDSKGNLQQYTTKDGISTVIIWGYDHTQPIAKIEGAQLSGISQSLIDTIVNASNTDAQNGTETSEQNLISALDTFRSDASLSGYQISTYTYDPLIGVRSITPPSGIREYYRYDSANRLEKVIDSDKKVLKEFKYNYKN